MGKQRKTEEREITRKETVRRRRDMERNRRLTIGLIAVAVLLVGLIGAGIAQELLIKPRQPVAIVNGSAITTQEYGKRVRLNWFQSGQQVTDPQGSSLQVLDQMIDEQLLRQQAQERGITVSEDEVNQSLEESFGYQRTPPTPAPTATAAPTATPDPAAEATDAAPTPAGPTSTPFPTPTPVSFEAYQEAYRNYLDRLEQATGMTEAEFRRLVETDLLQQKLYEAVTQDVPATEEQVHARHILVAIRTPQPTPEPQPTVAGATPTPEPTAGPSPTPTPEPRDDAQALARIEEVQQKLAAGEDFAALAEEYSDDPGSAAEGGDLGWFGRGEGLVPEFEEAAFSLETGEVSEPVQTQFGYHLIKVEEKDPARPMEEFKLQQRKYEAYQAWLEGVRQAASIERNWTLDKVPPTPLGA